MNENIQKELLTEFADDMASMASSQRGENVMAFADDHVVVKISRNETTIKELKKQITKLTNRSQKKVSKFDLMQILIDLGHPMKMKEIEEMIWEVDEDLDKCLNWVEFKLMYERNITDRTGLEPSRMVSECQNCLLSAAANFSFIQYSTVHIIHYIIYIRYFHIFITL